MSADCSHRGCHWECPAGTPENMVLYVVDLHRAYDCPQANPRSPVLDGQSGTHAADARSERSEVER